MEFARFFHAGQTRIGRRAGGKLQPVHAATLAEALTTNVEPAGPAIAEAEVQLLPALDPTAKILCVALNYVDHAKEAKQPLPETPILFFKSQEAMIGAGRPITVPSVVTQLDYEGELAIVFGREAFNVSEADCWSYIAGVAPFNDVSSRNLLSVKAGEKVHLDWFSAKCLDRSTPMGPSVTRLDTVIDDLTAKRSRVQTRVNGEVRQNAQIVDMIFDIPKLVAFASSRVRFSPGDVIATGTPPGVGFADGRYMKKGDIVEIEITGLPVLRNVVG